MREHLQLFKWYGSEKHPLLAYENKKVGTEMYIFHMDEHGYDWDWLRINPRQYYDTLDKCPPHYKLEKLMKLIFEYDNWKS